MERISKNEKFFGHKLQRKSKHAFCVGFTVRSV